MTFHAIHTCGYLRPVSTVTLLEGRANQDELIRVMLNATALTYVAKCRQKNYAASDINFEVEAAGYTLIVLTDKALGKTGKNKRVSGSLLRTIAMQYARLIGSAMEMFKLDDEHPLALTVFTQVAQTSEQPAVH
jgi:hypothetical protein